MLIDLKKMEEKVLPEFKGGEKQFNVKMFTDDAVKVMKGRLIPGASIGMHSHDTNSEILYILDGVGTMLFDGKTEILNPGDCHYCPQGKSHSLMNKGEKDLVFFAVVPERG